MSTIRNLNSQKGFRDLYPAEKAAQEYIFEKLKLTARLFGYESYDGPILEDIQIYLDKTSRELIDRQTFQVKDKKDQTLVMRPEMTPSLARMIANKGNELTLPLKLFNLGLRFRYEAPQKGREREFYQADFDILGSESILADAEIIATAVNIFKSLGASKDDVVLYLNSRSEMERSLISLGYSKEQFKRLLDAIDKQDKISKEEFVQFVLEIDTDKEKADRLVSYLSTGKNESSEYFAELFSLLKTYGVDEYCEVNFNITRGLDYYTGVVFEVKEKGGMTRSLLGGGRYDNLVSTYNPNMQIPGVGFATSDVVLLAFAKDKNLIPVVSSKPSTVLVTIFNKESVNKSIEIVTMLRNNKINAELYPSSEKKMDKQLKYADKNKIPYVLIIGPNEIEKETVVLKNMKTTEQKEIQQNELISSLT